MDNLDFLERPIKHLKFFLTLESRRGKLKLRVLKSPKTPLRNIYMVPYTGTPLHNVTINLKKHVSMESVLSCLVKTRSKVLRS